jgi:glucoamylase
VRDAAVAIRVLPEVVAAVEPDERPWWLAAFRAHVAFSLGISDPERAGPARHPLAGTTRADRLEFLRAESELAKLIGDGWMGEPRFSPDGGPDLERWNRPQDDGPALRASACLRVTGALPELRGPEVERLLLRDLAFVRRVAGRPSIGPWEEEPARRTTFTLIAEWDALDRGAAWREAQGDAAGAEILRATAGRVRALICEAADPDEPAWRESIEAPAGHFDSATVLALLHADRESGPFALTAPRTLGTVAALERRFAELYPINRGRLVPAMGRWPGDAYFGGNPWYPVTLGCAELHYRVATLTGAACAYEKGEAWMALIEEVAPAGDDLPEQFDRATGAPVSCLALTWSAAALIGAATAREGARQTLAAR